MSNFDWFYTGYWFTNCGDCGAMVRVNKFLRLEGVYCCDLCIKRRADAIIDTIMDDDGHGGKFIAIVDSY